MGLGLEVGVGLTWHCCGLSARGVHCHRQRADGASSAGARCGVSMGRKPAPRTVTTVPPSVGPPVGSMASTRCVRVRVRSRGRGRVRSRVRVRVRVSEGGFACVYCTKRW